MKKSLFSFAFAVCMLGALTVNAQDHVFSLGSASGLVGADVMVTMNYANNSTGDNIQGVNFGVCTADEAIATATAVDLLADGMGAFTANNVVAGGVTVAIVTSFAGNPTYDPGLNYDLASITYNIAAEGTTAINFCATLGSPPVMVDAANTAAMSVPVATMDGSVEGQAAPPPYIFTAESKNVNYDGVSGAGSTTVDFSIGENPMNALGADTSGFSMAVAHDSAVLTATMVDSGPLAANMGGAPAFEGPAILADGWTYGCIFSFTGALTLDFSGGAATVITTSYDVVGPVPPVMPNPTTDLTFMDLGDPIVPNDITIGTDSQEVILENGTLTLVGLVDLAFVRGDCNQDLLVNIADGITILSALFQGGSTGGCAAACDANDMMGLDSADAVYIFNYRFLGGPVPPAPFPDCGVVAGADCEATACP